VNAALNRALDTPRQARVWTRHRWPVQVARSASVPQLLASF
jgi:hypothetical protein